MVVSHHQCGDDLSGGNSVGELLRSHCRTVSVIGDIFTTILETNYAIVQSVFTIYIHPMEKIHILSSPKLPSPSPPLFYGHGLGLKVLFKPCPCVDNAICMHFLWHSYLSIILVYWKTCVLKRQNNQNRHSNSERENGTFTIVSGNSISDIQLGTSFQFLD